MVSWDSSYDWTTSDLSTPPDSTWLPLIRKILSYDWMKTSKDKVKAACSDGAEVPVELWNSRNILYFPQHSAHSF